MYNTIKTEVISVDMHKKTMEKVSKMVEKFTPDINSSVAKGYSACFAASGRFHFS